jgi:ParB-like chromosome segregation protein Spo0J
MIGASGFTTNNKEELPKRFVSRCRTVEFSREGMATEIVRLLARIWAAELPSHEARDFQQIARAADGDVRAAINSLEMLILSSQRQSGEVPHLPTSTIRSSSDHDMEDNPNEPFHSACRVFPEMCPQSFAVLKLDIEEHGVRVPIVMHEGMILDGRSRWRAAQELGIACPTTEYAGSEPLLEIVSLNGIRRDLSSGQRAMAAAKIANISEGRPRKTRPADSVSQDKSARLLNVSVKSVQRAKKILQANRPDLVAAVFSGSMSVSRAAMIVIAAENGPPATDAAPLAASPSRSPRNAENSIWFWKEMLLFEKRRIMDLAPAELLSEMSDEQSSDVFHIVPGLIAWLQALVGERWEGWALTPGGRSGSDSTC